MLLVPGLRGHHLVLPRVAPILLVLFTGHTSTVGRFRAFGGFQRLTAYELTTWPPPKLRTPVSSRGRAPKPARDIGMPVPAKNG